MHNPTYSISNKLPYLIQETWITMYIGEHIVQMIL